MNSLLNSLSNFVNSTASEQKFQITQPTNTKLNQLSAVPDSTQTVKDVKIKPQTKYRLLRRQDELILQHSTIQQGNLIWIDIPTVTEE